MEVCIHQPEEDDLATRQTSPFQLLDSRVHTDKAEIVGQSQDDGSHRVREKAPRLRLQIIELGTSNIQVWHLDD